MIINSALIYSLKVVKPYNKLNIKIKIAAYSSQAYPFNIPESLESYQPMPVRLAENKALIGIMADRIKQSA